jgi:hypothetical protein
MYVCNKKSKTREYSDSLKNHTTIALSLITKAKIDTWRAPGQCYEECISELIDYWERYKIGSSLCGPGRPIQHGMER